jgi:hypothetical protein
VAQRTLRGAINQSLRTQQLAEQQAAIGTNPRYAAQRQQAQTAPRDTQVVQRAGTKPNQPSIDGRYRIKLSSEREEFSYENRGPLGLDNVLPRHHKVVDHDLNDEGEVMAVHLDDRTRVILKTPIPAPSADKHLLCIDTVGFDRLSPRGAADTTGDTKLFMDVKIGHFTKSGQQFALEGANWFMQTLKQAEHDLKDIWRYSDEGGYDIDADDLEKFRIAHLKAIALQGRRPMRRAMNAITPRLEFIEATMSRAPVTFVGASVFIVLNLTDPDSSAVNIIDPDHPILLDAPEETGVGAVPGGVMDSSKMRGGREWDRYKKKWMANFGSGMTNFVKWWKYRTSQVTGQRT